MPQRLEHYPNAQYESILAQAASGTPMRIDCESDEEAVRFQNAYMSWRSVVLREVRARRHRLPYGFDEVSTQRRGPVVRFIMREMTRQFQAVGRVVAEGPNDEQAAVGATDGGVLGGEEKL